MDLANKSLKEEKWNKHLIGDDIESQIGFLWNQEPNSHSTLHRSLILKATIYAPGALKLLSFVFGTHHMFCFVHFSVLMHLFLPKNTINRLKTHPSVQL